MIFELIDEISLSKHAKQNISQVCSLYKLDTLVNDYWISDKNKKKYLLIKNNINKFIFCSRIEGYIKKFLYCLSRLKMVKRIYYKKKYPDTLRK